MSAKSNRLPGKFRVRGRGNVEYAGFDCGVCWEPVRVIRKPLPASVPKLGIFSCGCETAVLVFEHEAQPTARNWVRVMSYAATLNGNVLIFMPFNLRPGAIQVVLNQGR
jgi:hypothetical protein